MVELCQNRRMSIPSEVLVVGAGIVGAACALELSREGRRVHVLDAAAGGDGATAAGMGHLLILDGSTVELDFTRLSRSLWNELGPGLPPAAEWNPCGTLWIAEDDDEMATARAKQALLTSQGVECEILDAAALREAEPELREGLLGGLLVPDDGVVYPPAIVGAWLDEARRRGATLELGTAVARVDDEGATLADGSRRHADWTVVAAGQRTLELLDDPPPVRLRPRKGHLAITDRYPGLLRHHVSHLGYAKSAHGDAAESVAFTAHSRLTGQVFVGSSRQFDRSDRAIEPAILARMLRNAVRFLPRLRELRVIRAWTGLRSATADQLPLIGPLAALPRVVLAAGHEGLGITTSLGTARLVADIVAGRPSEIDRSSFLPERAS